LTKVIAVQDNLQNIKDEIKRKGYKVVDLENTNEIIDAMVYSATIPDGISSSNHNLGVGSNSAFVLMINADENSKDEIISLLEDI
jgi:hypothetical protein